MRKKAKTVTRRRSKANKLPEPRGAYASLTVLLQHATYDTIQARAITEGIALGDFIREAVDLRLAHRRVTQLVETSPAPRMPFGKYAGRKLSEIPTAYLRWVLENALAVEPELKDALRKELLSRQCQEQDEGPF